MSTQAGIAAILAQLWARLVSIASQLAKARQEIEGGSFELEPRLPLPEITGKVSVEGDVE